MYCRAKKLPPFDVVNKLIAYNIITGVFTWKVNKSNKKAGSVAGRVKKKSGYRYITINKQECAAHRVAWLLVTKKDPWPYEVDHINHNKSDNAFKYLRKASEYEKLNLFGSLLIPSKQFIARFKFRPWKGVHISENY